MAGVSKEEIFQQCGRERMQHAMTNQGSDTPFFTNNVNAINLCHL